MRSLGVILFLAWSFPLLAQGAGVTAVDTPAVGAPSDVRVTVPPAIEKLLTDYSAREHRVNGYRVQIFLGDRATAEATKRTFLQNHPEIPAYLSWLAPNFRLRVGDLRTRLEAERLLRDVKEAYPGSYIVPDEIEMPRVD
ncbi:MAG: SPOR domain-containing protein [Flavobacteriales bacterium]